MTASSSASDDLTWEAAANAIFLIRWEKYSTVKYGVDTFWRRSQCQSKVYYCFCGENFSIYESFSHSSLWESTRSATTGFHSLYPYQWILYSFFKPYLLVQESGPYSDWTSGPPYRPLGSTSVLKLGYYCHRHHLLADFAARSALSSTTAVD